MEKSQYQEVSGRRVRFDISTSWWDLTEGRLAPHPVFVIDNEGYHLDFSQLTEPKPTVRKNKNKPQQADVRQGISKLNNNSGYKITWYRYLARFA